MKKARMYQALFLTGSMLISNGVFALQIIGQTVTNTGTYTNSDSDVIEIRSLTSNPPGGPGQPGIRGNFNNASGGVVNNYGSIETYWVPGYYAGSVHNSGEFNNISVFTSGFTSIGRVINNGEFWNAENAIATNGGHWETSYYFDNYGTFTNTFGSYSFDNTGTAWNHNTFRNQGFLSNSGYFTNADVATMDNSLLFLNDGTLRNHGTFVNSGEIISSATTVISSTGTVSGKGSFIQTAGEAIVDGSLEASIISIDGGALSGSGSIQGDVFIGSGAEVNPGNSPGTLFIDGDFLLESSGLLTLEVEGSGAGQFDRLIISGDVNLMGDIRIAILSGYTLSSFLSEFEIGDFLRIGTESNNDPLSDLSLLTGANISAFYGAIENEIWLLNNGTFSDTAPSDGTAPEPTPVALIGLGLAAIGFKRYRNKIAT